MNVIYKIRNLLDGKFYVGSTTDFHVRSQNHRRLLRKGRHHCKHLQGAWTKYGEEVFKFEAVETVPDGEDLQAAEDRWLSEHHGQAHCYNMGRRSDAPWRGGRKEDHPAFGRAKTDEERAAISSTLKAFYAADPANHPRRGVKHTPEAIAKMALKTVHRGADHYRFGKTLSDEVKAKIGAAQKGIKKGPRALTPEGRARIMAAAAAGHYSHGKGRKREYAECESLRKRVIEHTSGLEFDSLTAALTHFELKMPTLARALKSGRPLSKGPKAGLRFSYLTPTQLPDIKRLP